MWLIIRTTRQYNKEMWSNYTDIQQKDVANYTDDNT